MPLRYILPPVTKQPVKCPRCPALRINHRIPFFNRISPPHAGCAEITPAVRLVPARNCRAARVSSCCNDDFKSAFLIDSQRVLYVHAHTYPLMKWFLHLMEELGIDSLLPVFRCLTSPTSVGERANHILLSASRIRFGFLNTGKRFVLHFGHGLWRDFACFRCVCTIHGALLLLSFCAKSISK
jgi:hypothetical protein